MNVNCEGDCGVLMQVLCEGDCGMLMQVLCDSAPTQLSDGPQQVSHQTCHHRRVDCTHGACLALSLSQELLIRHLQRARSYCAPDLSGTLVVLYHPGKYVTFSAFRYRVMRIEIIKFFFLISQVSTVDRPSALRFCRRMKARMY